MSQLRSDFKATLDAIGAALAESDETITEVKVYGQEPPNTGIKYPCIIYKEDFEEVKRADNIPYDITDRYSVMVIEQDPNRPVAKAVRQLPMCSFNRRYEADQLIHTVYNIYF